MLPLIHCGIIYLLLDVLPEGRPVTVVLERGVHSTTDSHHVPSRLFRSLLFLEVAPPTASIVVVLAHVANKPKMAQLCAFALVPQYLIAIFSVTLIVVRITQYQLREILRVPPPPASLTRTSSSTLLLLRRLRFT